jgi:hypothetical protein
MTYFYYIPLEIHGFTKVNISFKQVKLLVHGSQVKELNFQYNVNQNQNLMLPRDKFLLEIVFIIFKMSLGRNFQRVHYFNDEEKLDLMFWFIKRNFLV